MPRIKQTVANIEIETSRPGWHKPTKGPFAGMWVMETTNESKESSESINDHMVRIYENIRSASK